jgi:transposase-like protein
VSDFVGYHCVELPCPNCGHGTQKTLAWLKEHTEYVCAECGTTVNLDTDEFRRRIHDVEETAYRLGF